MAAKIAVVESDIVVQQERATFGLPHCRSIGAMVTILGEHTVARFRRSDGTAEYVQICGTCQGTGFRPQFAGIFEGVCFPCNGIGLGKRVGNGTPVEVVRVLHTRQLARRRREAKRLAALETQRQAHSAWLARQPELAAKLAQVRATALFAPLTKELAVKGGHSVLSAAQVALFESCYAENLAEAAQKQAATTAREWVGQVKEKITFTGKLVFTTQSWNNFGGYERCSTLYVLTAENGATVKWWRTGSFEPTRLEIYTITATVKELGESAEYGKFTQVTRGTIVSLSTEEQTR